MNDNGEEEWLPAFVSCRTQNGMNFVYESEPNNTYHFTKDEATHDLRKGDLYVKEINA